MYSYCVVPLIQTLSGGSLEVSGHSILPSTIKGVLTVGQHTHVFIDFTRLQMMVTFQEKCPVQLEAWRPHGESEESREITDVVRSEWANVGDGIKLPIQIQAMHLSRVRTAELNASISWRIGDDVDKQFFDKSTLGACLPSFRNESSND